MHKALMQPDAHHSPLGNGIRLRLLIAVIGSTSAALGSLVMIGWHLHLLAVLQLRPGLAPMQYNTAVCFLLTGVALIAWAWGKMPGAVPILGGVVAAAGGLTLAEYLFSTDLRIDQLLFRCYLITETSPAGRMSPVSASCFVFTGLALLCLGTGMLQRRRSLAVGLLGSLIVSITLVALMGYAFQLPGTYGWGQFTRIAVHTAAGLALVGAGLFLIAWKIGLRPGERTPPWLPLSLALGILSGSLVLYFALDSEEDQEISQTVRAGTESVKNQTALRMDGRIRSLRQMAQRWEFAGGTSKAAWEQDAANYVRDFPDLQALEWIDATHHVRWIVPLSGNEAKLNLDLTREKHRRAAVDAAEREHQPVITSIVPLFRGGLGCIIYVPIKVNGQPAGLIAAIIKAASYLDRYVSSGVAAGEAIQFSENGRVFYERSATAPPIRKNWIVDDRIQLHGATWDIRMWPTPVLASRLYSPLPQVVAIAGALCALLLGGVCYFAQRSSRQATETARNNAALQAALDKVKTLEGLLPICSCCKSVRDDTGYWSQIDTYLGQHTRASLSHGYCPQCAAKTFQEFGLDVPEEVTAAVVAGNFEQRRVSA
jgi:sensor domain CHASE-containing protein